MVRRENAKRSPARAELAAEIDRVASIRTALAEMPGKIENAASELYSVGHDIDAAEGDFPVTREGVAQKQAKIGQLNQAYQQLRQGKATLEGEERQLKENLSYATAALQRKLSAVLAEEAPITGLVREYRQLSEKMAARYAEISALLRLAGFNQFALPDELFGWDRTPAQVDESRAAAWRSFAKTLESDPDAPMPRPVAA